MDATVSTEVDGTLTRFGSMEVPAVVVIAVADGEGGKTAFA
jgi:hypothetical protein